MMEQFHRLRSLGLLSLENEAAMMDTNLSIWDRLSLCEVNMILWDVSM